MDRPLPIACLLSLVLSFGFALSSQSLAVVSSPAAGATAEQTSELTAQYCGSILSQVDSLVRNKLYSETLARNAWPVALEKYRSAILSSRNMVELGRNINLALKSLNISHCQFVTGNDETYYFLHSLFASRRSKTDATHIDFTGAITGGANFQSNQVRYILDGSPAAKAGVQVGDVIESINGKNYTGQLDYLGKSGQMVPLIVKRGSQQIQISIKPERKNCYQAYVDAIEKSVRIINTPEGKIGYVHFWTGGHLAHQQLEELLADKLISTQGLILDLRDGYGAAFFDDLDYFYRSPKAYPIMKSVDRSGRVDTNCIYYDKPVVAIINGGSRSGKELLAYSLKQTGRAKLVGERTAGAVLGGRLFPLDSRCSLFLAVTGPLIGDLSLEGKGVEPDLSIPADFTQAGYDRQRQEAERILREEMQAASNTSPLPIKGIAN